MNTVICPKCGNENKNTNIKCEFCGAELNSLEQSNKDFKEAYKKVNNLTLKIEKYMSILLIIFIAGPILLTGLFFTGISSYNIIHDISKSKNYLETEGNLVGYDCEHTDNLCSAIYEYKVNGITYEGSPNSLSERSQFKQKIIVKYNPNNPSEYLMNANWSSLLIWGVMMLVISLVEIISMGVYKRKKIMSKRSDKNQSRL